MYGSTADLKVPTFTFLDLIPSILFDSMSIIPKLTWLSLSGLYYVPLVLDFALNLFLYAYMLARAQVLPYARQFFTAMPKGVFYALFLVKGVQSVVNSQYILGATAQVPGILLFLTVNFVSLVNYVMPLVNAFFEFKLGWEAYY